MPPRNPEATPDRRALPTGWVRTLLSLLLLTLAGGAGPAESAPEDLDPRLVRSLPLGEPQLLIDDYYIDNRFNEDQISARVPHVLHTGRRHPEPLLRKNPDFPWEQHGVGYSSVCFDPPSQKFRLYYQIWNPRSEDPNTPRGGYRTCYAESEDGLTWSQPLFDFEPWGEHRLTNILLSGQGEAKAAHIIPRLSSGVTRRGEMVTNLGALPEEAFRGADSLLFYCDHEHFLAVSSDGLDWKERQSMLLPNRVDCFQSIVHDPAANEYTVFYRNRLIYDDSPKDRPSRGNTRFLSRISGPDLWSLWDHLPTPVLIPDAADEGRFYNMPVFRYGGVYLGFLSQFAESPQTIEVELVYSRDGFDWKRVPGAPRLIPVGPEGAWDDGMVFSADRILEVGEEWRLYYTGHDGPHDSEERDGALGLISFGRERLVSIQADSRGKTSYVVTRPIIWPGGELHLNADAQRGGLRVAVTDPWRRPLEGFSFEDCIPFNGDATRHRVAWKASSMSRLKGQPLRIEIEFTRADLFAFLAAEE